SYAATTIASHPLSLPDALPIFFERGEEGHVLLAAGRRRVGLADGLLGGVGHGVGAGLGALGRLRVGLGLGGRLPSRPECLAVERSEEHTSELQSRENLVCRLLL